MRKLATLAAVLLLGGALPAWAFDYARYQAVSYTHLTLPTNREV